MRGVVSRDTIPDPDELRHIVLFDEAAPMNEATDYLISKVFPDYSAEQLLALKKRNAVKCEALLTGAIKDLKSHSNAVDRLFKKGDYSGILPHIMEAHEAMEKLARSVMAYKYAKSHGYLEPFEMTCEHCLEGLMSEIAADLDKQLADMKQGDSGNTRLGNYL